MMGQGVLFVFWLSLLAFAWVYAGFPLLLAAVGTLRSRPVRKAPETPRLSLVIAAYNEEEVIAARLENDLLSDYPPDALEIIVASDGSADETNAIVAGFADRGIRLLALPRMGKNRAVEAAVRQATGDIVVFSDANIFLEPHALRALAANFADPEVGGVAGNAGYRVKPGSESSSYGETLYWRYDTWLKELESRTGSIVSAHGALYALRRELYQPPADQAVTDDFAISTAVIEQGYRLVFERDARAFEFAVQQAMPEFHRRVRLMTRGLRGVALRRRLLNPRRFGFYSFTLFTHKVMRRLLPVALVTLFLSSVHLGTTDRLYLIAAVAQLAFYTLAGTGFLLRRTPLGRRRWLYVPFYFCMANTAALSALHRFMRGETINRWEPQRHAGSA
jgi:cellulose synthase/poly-beta-1,6-N-acetylglucosamine synthase-like glycosyltransferase